MFRTFPRGIIGVLSNHIFFSNTINSVLYRWGEWHTEKNECLIYSFSTSIRCLQMHNKHRTICYNKLTSKLKRNRGGTKYCKAKRCKISQNINQLNINLLINLFVACPTNRQLRHKDRIPDTSNIPPNASGLVGIPLKKGASGARL